MRRRSSIRGYVRRSVRPALFSDAYQALLVPCIQPCLNEMNASITYRFNPLCIPGAGIGFGNLILFWVEALGMYYALHLTIYESEQMDISKFFTVYFGLYLAGENLGK